MAAEALALDIQRPLTAAEESELATVWRRFRRHKLALFGLAVIILFTALAVFAPVISPHDPNAIDLRALNRGPTAQHWFGTDELGRDVFTRLLYAGRISLYVGFAAAIIAEVFGVLVGSVSGYFGGWVDAVLMRFVEFVIALPFLPMLFIVAAIFGGGNPHFIVLLLAIFSWTSSARLVRGVILSLKEQEFTEACRALGVSDWKIIVRHMIPNSMAPIIVNVTLGVGVLIVVEAILSFLGFGTQPPNASWGKMLETVQRDMWLAPWKAFFPGFMIFMTSLSFNFVGDGLRDALDPRLKL